MSFGRWYCDNVARAHGWTTFPKVCLAIDHTKQMNGQLCDDIPGHYVVMARECYNGPRYYFPILMPQFWVDYQHMPAALSTFYEVIEDNQPCRYEYFEIFSIL